MGFTVVIGAALMGASCIRFSPFQVDLSTEERDHTAKNLAKLASKPRGPASPEAPLTFAFLADTHDGYRNWDTIVTAINGRSDIELVLHGGDLTDFGSQQEYRWAYDVFSRQKVPFLTAPGNHDGLSNGRQLYAEMLGPTNYTFDYAGIHFVVFNTNPIEWKLTEPDFDWLERETRTGDAATTTTVVLTHQPPVSAPNTTTATATRLHHILENASVALYLYGHLHNGFDDEQVGKTRFVKTQSALDGSWVRLTFDGSRFDAQTCRFDACPVEDFASHADGAELPGDGGTP